LAAPLLLGVDQSWWPGAKTALIAFAAFVALIAFAAFILRKPGLLIKWVEVFSRIFPQKFQKALRDFFLSGAYSFHILRQPRIIASLVLFSFFFVGVQALSNYFVFLAFGWRLSFWAALIVLLTLQVVSIPPSALGKIGIFEYMVILALSIYGVEKEEALGYAVLLHLVVYLPKIMMGFCFIARGRSTKRPPPAETGGLEIK
jgi:glycosyltransferase 2 family protein